MPYHAFISSRCCLPLRSACLWLAFLFAHAYIFSSACCLASNYWWRSFRASRARRRRAAANRAAHLRSAGRAGKGRRTGAADSRLAASPFTHYLPPPLLSQAGMRLLLTCLPPSSFYLCMPLPGGNGWRSDCRLLHCLAASPSCHYLASCNALPLLRRATSSLLLAQPAVAAWNGAEKARPAADVPARAASGRQRGHGPRGDAAGGRAK